jgi:hypothetical protein
MPLNFSLLKKRWKCWDSEHLKLKFFQQSDNCICTPGFDGIKVGSQIPPGITGIMTLLVIVMMLS